MNNQNNPDNQFNFQPLITEEHIPESNNPYQLAKNEIVNEIIGYVPPEYPPGNQHLIM